MNRDFAYKVSLSSDNDDIKEMLIRARAGIKDWTERSRLNPGLSRGAVFNIFASCSFAKPWVTLSKTNAIFEFGDYHPKFKHILTKANYSSPPRHEEPMEFPIKSKTEEKTK
jgi:hypothetical protein